MIRMIEKRSSVLISSKGRITLPMEIRLALGMKPGMRVDVTVVGECVRLTPVAAKASTTLEEIQQLLKYSGPRIPISAMRMTAGFRQD